MSSFGCSVGALVSPEEGRRRPKRSKVQGVDDHTRKAYLMTVTYATGSVRTDCFGSLAAARNALCHKDDERRMYPYTIVSIKIRPEVWA